MRTLSLRTTKPVSRKAGVWNAGIRNAGGRVAAFFLAAFALTGCLAAPEVLNDAQPRVRMNLSLERPASPSMQLKTLQVTLRSNRGHLVRDTITDQGGTLSGAHVVLNPAGDQGQILTPRYELSPAEEWICVLQSFDLRDSLIHDEEYLLGSLSQGDIRDLPLRVGARVAAYEGVFTATGAMYGSQAVTVHRAELVIDGMVHDAIVSGTEGGNAIRILYEYLPTGRHDMLTRLYGTVGDDPTSRLLWEGRKRMDIRAGASAMVAIPLEWVLAPEGLAKAGSTLETMRAELLLGRVGHVVMNVGMPAAINI